MCALAKATPTLLYSILGHAKAGIIAGMISRVEAKSNCLASCKSKGVLEVSANTDMK